MNRLLTSERIDETAAEWVMRKDAGLSFEEEAEFIAWCSADPRHRHSLDRYQSTWREAGRPLRTGVAEVLELRIAAHRRKRQRRRLMSVTAALAAAIVVIFARQSPPAADIEPPAKTSSVLLVAHRQTLPDGSLVEYSADTKLSVDFSGAARRVSLTRGEAHFTVAKDAGWPFIVDAGGVEFRAVGTAFAVQLNHLSAELLVTEGRVAVEKAGSAVLLQLDEQKGALGVVEAGNRVVIELQSSVPRATEVAAISASELDDRLGWRKPRVEFSATPLREVVSLLNHHNVTQLVIDDPALAGIELSGIFRADDIDSLVRSLEVGFGIKSEATAGLIHLRAAR